MLILSLLAGLALGFSPQFPLIAVSLGLAVVIGASLTQQPLYAGLLLAIFSIGPIQRVIVVLSQDSSILSVDDLIFALTALVTIPLLWRRNRRLLPIGFVIASLLAYAAVRAANVSVGLYQARQVAIVVIGILIGMVLVHREMRFLAHGLAILLVIQLTYMTFELIAGPPVSPLDAVGLTEFQGTETRLGLPAAYLFYYGSSDTDYLLRLGGTLLNPPSAGIWLAGVVVFLSFVKRSIRLPLQIAGVGFLFLTYARAGILILACAVLFPWLARLFKSSVRSFVVMLGLAGIAAFFVNSQGSSSRHSDGLTEGVGFALSGPFGSGFGKVGNSVKYVQEAAGESLLGIAASGLGLLIFVPIMWILYRSVGRQYWKVSSGQGVVIGGLLATAFSESVGGLDSSLPLWILVGYSLQLLTTEVNSEQKVGKYSSDIMDS